ncbi:MAG: aldehyde dehydrogenase family protein, partial [Bacteroidota bacterium]|nr:aldehyde dehydrogenase family protein [Bacteroidota bacterium]
MNLDFLKELGLSTLNSGTSTGATWGKQDEASQIITSLSPVDGKEIGQVYSTSPEAYENVVEAAEEAFKEWRTWPAPKRGEIVRQIGNALRDKKEALGKLVSYEMGKSYQEGLGEVQEMIDICDFSVGLSRQLYGLTMVSERPNHKLSEKWHPLGVVGIISAFNFPVAVWSWNSMIAWVCGDVCIWKPSEKAPICGVACQKIVQDVFAANNVPEGVSCLVNGD